eukprot:scaffold24750_cov178-Skeletonema_dohrnii-CCMP3373.AAC.1
MMPSTSMNKYAISFMAADFAVVVQLMQDHIPPSSLLTFVTSTCLFFCILFCGTHDITLTHVVFFACLLRVDVQQSKITNRGERAI